MKCEDLLALKGVGWKNLTPSLALAGARHLRDCASCRERVDADNATLPPCAQAASVAAAVGVMLAIEQKMATDPELR